MNRESYMQELSFLLSDLNDDDRDEALEYYNSYFIEAGQEHEDEVIEKLGDPSRIAAMIKADLNHCFDEYIECGSEGIKNDQYERHQEVMEVKQSFKERVKQDHKVFLILALAIGIPLCLPLFGIGLGAVGVIASILVSIAVFFLSFWIVAIGLCGLGIALIVCGVLQLFVSFATGLICIGVGIIVLTIGKIVFKVAKWFFITAIPYVIDRLSMLLNKRGRQDEVFN